jgi:hypothetical protein
MTKKCMICSKHIKKSERTVKLKDFILIMDGIAHEDCYLSRKENKLVCYQLVENNVKINEKNQ